MAEAYQKLTQDIAVDLDELSKRSDLYRALVNFHGSDALNILTYPDGAPFSENCFRSAVECLGSKDDFTGTMKIFRIKELFDVSLYLGSDCLLYHVVFDMLMPTNAVSILDMSIDFLGMNHFITKAVIHFIMVTLDFSYNRTMLAFQDSKQKLRKVLKNCKRRQEPFVVKTRLPHSCLCCMKPMTGLYQKDVDKRVAPLICCGMLVHLKCELNLFKAKQYPKCPACQTIFAEGEICTELNVLDSVMTIRYLKNYGIYPLPYRVRSEIWENRNSECSSKVTTYGTLTCG